MTLTALDLAKKVLEENGSPMGSEDIWEYAVKKGYHRDTKLEGKTPWRSIEARMYMNIKNGGSDFIQVSSRPPRFGLQGMDQNEEPVKEPVKKPARSAIKERDLHPLLVTYVAADAHFRARTKTIHHEVSVKTVKNAEKWMHPDLVSVRLPFDEFREDIIELADSAGIDTFTIFSFEMKTEITGSNVREFYFQAVSNSSWANEGYLVAPRINEDALMQLSRLNSSFGIGVIRLDVEDPHQSEILLPAVARELDLGMMDDLSRINPEFAEFVSSLVNSMKIKQSVGKFDPISEAD